MIETKRLILRPFRVEDAADVYEYLSDPKVNCLVDLKLDSIEDSIAEMSKRQQDSELFFAIVLKETGKVIGEIVALQKIDEATKQDLETYSPSWMLNEEYCGKGYGFEAVSAFFDYLFNQKGARRIYAYTDDYNTRSQHFCEKLGMRKEGFFKEFVSFVNNEDGTPHYENTYQYAILKKEWDALKK